MSEKYIFKKFKQNIFLLFYNDNIISFNKLIKIPFDYYNEYESNSIVVNSEYKEYFEKITDIFVFENIIMNKNLEIKLSDTNTNIQINLYELVKNEILGYSFFINYFIEQYSKDLKYGIIDKIVFLIEDYNINKITLNHYLSQNKISEKIDMIINVMNILTKLQKNIHFVHGDLKLNNILYDEINENITFIDLEFTYFTNKNLIPDISDISRINLYLKASEKYILSNDLLYIFDIYLFTLSVFITKPIKYNQFFNIFLKKFVEDNDYLYDYNNFYIFIIIYELLINYCLTYNIFLGNLKNETFHKHCSLKYIYGIVYKNINMIKDNKLKPVVDYIVNAFKNI